MSKRNEIDQSERRTAVRREVMKGVNEIRRGEGKVYYSAEKLAAGIIKRGKDRRAKTKN